MKRQWRRLVTCMTLVALLYTSAPAGMMASLRARVGIVGCAADCGCRFAPAQIVKKSGCSCGKCDSEALKSAAVEETGTESDPPKNSCPCCPDCPGCCWCSIAKAPCVPSIGLTFQLQAELTDYVLDLSLLFPPVPCREIIQPPKI